MNTSTPTNDSAHWRRRAEEARRAADQSGDQSTKQILLEIAAAYEQLAALMEGSANGSSDT